MISCSGMTRKTKNKISCLGMTSETVPQWICQSLWRLESPSSLSRVQMSPAWWAVQKKLTSIPMTFASPALWGWVLAPPDLGGPSSCPFEGGQVALSQIFAMMLVFRFSGHPTWGHSHIKQGFGSQTSSWSSTEHSRCFSKSFTRILRLATSNSSFPSDEIVFEQNHIFVLSRVYPLLKFL